MKTVALCMIAICLWLLVAISATFLDVVINAEKTYLSSDIYFTCEKILDKR